MTDLLPPPRSAHPGSPPEGRWDRPDLGFRLRLLMWRARRVLAVGVLVAAALGVHRVLSPPPSPVVPVVVADGDVAAGTTLEAQHLRLVRFPAALAPAGSADRTDLLVGRQVAWAVPSGLPVVPAALAGDRFDVDPPPGAVVVPVRLGDPAVAALLHAGDTVDLVTGGTADAAGAPTEVEVVAHRALVLESARSAAGDRPLGLGGEEGPVVTVVAVDADEGRRLAAVTSWEAVGAVLVG